MKYEYKTHGFSGSVPVKGGHKLDKVLEGYSNKGWELNQVINDSLGLITTLIFRRPKPEK
jgi:hypothetical protein